MRVAVTRNRISSRVEYVKYLELGRRIVDEWGSGGESFFHCPIFFLLQHSYTPAKEAESHAQANWDKKLRFRRLGATHGLACIVSIFFLGICCVLAICLRFQNLPLLEGKYLLGTDSYRFLWQAETIVEHGRLPERDMTRWLPLGRDLTRQLSLSSYVIAGLYHLLNPFIPSLTVYQTVVYYPLILYPLILLMIYLVALRLFKRSTALLAVAILIVLPPELSRSMAGFADRDGLCLLFAVLSFYYYVRGIQADGVKQTVGFGSQLIWSFLSGIAMMLLGLTWEGAGLFIAVIVLLHLVKLMLDDYRLHDFYRYLSFIGPILLGLLTLTRTYWGGANYSSPFALVAISMPIGFAFLAGIYLLLRRSPRVVASITLDHRLPYGVSIVALAFLLFALVLLSLATLSEDVSLFVEAAKSNFFSPLGQSRLMQSVNELADSSLISWVRFYRFLLPCFSAGALLLLYHLCKKARLTPWIVMVAFGWVLINIFCSDGSLGLVPIIGHTISYLGSLVALIGTVAGLYVYRYWKARDSTLSNPLQLDEGRLLVVLWFLLTLSVARGAVRYQFFFAPVAAIIGAYILVCLHHRCIGKTPQSTERLFFPVLLVILGWEAYVLFQPRGYWWLIVAIVGTLLASNIVLLRLCKQALSLRDTMARENTEEKRKLLPHPLRVFIPVFGWVVLLLFLICLTSLLPPIGGYVQLSIKAASEFGPVSPLSWRTALDWMRGNLPSSSVVAAEWTFGSHINALSHKATVVDEDHFIPYWIYLMDRHVFLAQTEVEALQFLKTHGATHIVLTERDFFQLPATSYLGSNEYFDRRFNMVHLAASEGTDSGTRLHLVPDHQLGVGLSLDWKKHSPLHWLQSIELELTEPLTKLPSDDRNLQKSPRQSDSSFPEIKNAWVTAQIAGGTIRLHPSKLYFMGREIIAEGNAFPGGVVVFLDPTAKDESHLTAIYLPDVGYNALVTQLYLLNKPSPFFRRIYPADSQGIEKQQQPPSGAKIWEIHYPPDLSLNPDYLDTTFRNAKLYRSWMLGEETE